MRMNRFVAVLLAGVAAIGIAGCGEKNEYTVLIRMMPAQQRFFRDNIIREFEQQNNCKINVATFKNQWDIERELKLEAGNRAPEILLVKTPFEQTRVLAGKGYIKRLTDIRDSAQVMADLAEYHPLAGALGYLDGDPYFIPRKLETRVLFYLKSKVADAVEKFPDYRDAVDAELKKRNGYGLPSNYELENDPSEWDFYDLYSVGWVWANEEYNGVKMPRMAHRGALYGGTALFLVDRALQMGATQQQVLELTSEPMVQTYLWENQFVKSNLYNPGMWNDEWMGTHLYNGVKDGKVYLAYFQQIDCFNVHGWENDPGMPTYLPNPDDMGLSVVPKAVSFDLNEDGTPRTEGTRSISTGGWWWGIPSTSPDPELAYKLARFITNKENQAEECSKFGMLPVRKDILNNLEQVFDEGWVGDIYKVSVEQIRNQIEQDTIPTIPMVESYSQVARNLVKAWKAVAVEYDEKADGIAGAETVADRLKAEFVPEQKKLLGDDYPKE